MTRVEGFHGRYDGRHPSTARDLYLSPGREHAESYAETGLFHVSFTARSPLVFGRAEHFHEAWQASRAHEVVGRRFHPDTTQVFTDWARAQGHDAVVLPEHLFTTAAEDHEAADTLHGTFGDPQSIVLDPKRARIKRLR